MRARRIGVFWVKLAAFLCLLAMVCNAVGMLLSSDIDTSQRANALKRLPRDSVDVLWVGSSHIFFGVIPQMLYDEYGIASAMFSVPAMSIEQTYWGLKEVLQHQNPEVVIMDLFMATAPYSYSNALNELGLKQVSANTIMYNRLGQIARWLPIGSLYKPFAMWEANQRHGIPPADMLEITKLHDRYSLIRQSDFIETRLQSNFTLDFGFSYYFGTIGSDGIKQMDYTPEKAIQEGDLLWQFTEEQLAEVALLPEIREDLERIIQLTRSRGIKLVFCVAPYIINAAEDKIYQQIVSLAQEEGVGFVGAEEIEMGYDQLSDIGHMNAFGAVHNTAFWGEELLRRFDLPDRRQSADRRYAVWREHQGRYLSQIASRREYDTMSEYLEMLTELDEDFLILLGFQGAVYERFTEDDYWLLVEELGIPEDVLAQWYDTGEGTLNVLMHNKQVLASNYAQNERGGVELRWNAFGNAVSINGGRHRVNRRRMLGSDKDGLHMTVFSLSDDDSVQNISFDLTEVE